MDLVLATNELEKLLEQKFKQENNEIKEELPQTQKWDFGYIFEQYKIGNLSNKNDLINLKGTLTENFKFKQNSSDGASSSNNYLNQILMKCYRDQSGKKIDESKLKTKIRKNKDFMVNKFLIEI